MATLNVKVPDEMVKEIDAYLIEHPYYLNKSDLVRDTVRRLITGQRLAPEILSKVREGRAQVARGEPLVPLDELE